MIPQTDRDFFEVHGPHVRDPDNPKQWLFEDGSRFVESAARGISQGYEPPTNPAARIQVQLSYLRVVYATTWQEFEVAQRHKDIAGIRTKGEALKRMNQRMDDLAKEWRETPEIRQQREENVDAARRQRLVDLVVEEREQKLREEAAKAAAEYSTLPRPVRESQTVYDQFAKPSIYDETLAEQEHLLALLRVNPKAAKEAAIRYQLKEMRG